MPGTPSRHLPEAAISASKGIWRASIGNAPNELMASMIRRLPWRWITWAISASGLRMPVLVSQWIKATWVTAGSAASRRSTSAAVVGWSSAVSKVLWARPSTLQIFARR
ncbi:hypothetical protein D9M71_818880 [compost metagenome]